MISFHKLALALSFLIFGSVAMAQTPTPLNNFYAIGGSYNFNASPKIAGTAMYGHHITIPGTLPDTYGFAVIDVLPTSGNPITITNNVGAGVAQTLFSYGRYSLVMPTAAGVSWTGTNTGWQWTGGGAVFIKLKPGMYLVPTARFLKSSVSNGSGYQPILGLEFGFGN